MQASNDLLAPERKGRAGKSGGIISGLGGRPPFAPGEAGRSLPSSSRQNVNF
jgi:hypothetical protein